METIQSDLFHDLGVILVDRSSSFDAALANAVDDALRIVFRQPTSTLKTVAVENQLLIGPDFGDNGLMRAQTQTLTIYTSSIATAPDLVLFGLVVPRGGSRVGDFSRLRRQ